MVAAALSLLGLAASGSRSFEGLLVSDGTYVPDPTHSWFAGEVVEIHEDSFRRTYFTDVVGAEPPPITGSVKIIGDHILLDAQGLHDPERVPRVLRGTPVLWTIKAFAQWKKTGKIDELGVLYLYRKKS